MSGDPAVDVGTSRPPRKPTPAEVDVIEATSGPCRVLGVVGPDMILVSDLTATIRALRARVLVVESAQTDLVNELLDQAPDVYDDDVAGEAIAVRYVRDLEARSRVDVVAALEEWDRFRAVNDLDRLDGFEDLVEVLEALRPPSPPAGAAS